MNIVKIEVKFGKWFYKSVKVIVIGSIILVILAILFIVGFNEKIIANINAF